RAIYPGIPLVDDVLLHPEFFLHCASVSLIMATALALFALGWRVHRAPGSLAAALVSQGSIFLTAPVWTQAVAFVTPEGLLLPLTLAVAAILAPAAFSQRTPSHGAMLAAAAGVVLGACAATKTTSLPLGLAVLLLHGIGYRLLACAATVVAAIVMTLPISGKYGFLI